MGACGGVCGECGTCEPLGPLRWPTMVVYGDALNEGRWDFLRGKAQSLLLWGRSIPGVRRTFWGILLPAGSAWWACVASGRYWSLRTGPQGRCKGALLAIVPAVFSTAALPTLAPSRLPGGALGALPPFVAWALLWSCAACWGSWPGVWSRQLVLVFWRQLVRGIPESSQQ